MTGVTTWNKGTAPAGADGWNYVNVVRGGLESMNVIVPVASLAERNALTPPLGMYAGMTVHRTDTGRQEYWDGTVWRGRGIIPYFQSTFYSTPNYPNATEVSVALLSIPDPGVPYYIRPHGGAVTIFSDTSAGIDATIRLTNSTGTVLGKTSHPSGVPTGLGYSMQLGTGIVNGPYTGAQSVVADITRVYGSGAWTVNAGGNCLAVDVIPS